MRTKLSEVLVFAAVVAFLFSEDAAGQYTPAAGPIDSEVIFQRNSSQPQGQYHLTLNGSTITVGRPGRPNYVYTDSGTPILSYAFVGNDWLLIMAVEEDFIQVRHKLTWVQLNASGVEDVLYDGREVVANRPAFQVFRNSDGMAIFTRLGLADLAIDDVFEIKVYRTDTGNVICEMQPVNSSPGDTIEADISGRYVTITWNCPPNASQEVSCALPAANLEVSPQPLNFGEIRSDQTSDKAVTLKNTGTDVITVNAVTAAGAFSPVGFFPVSLSPGVSRQIAIRFNPAGVVGNFDETLPITRTPAVGAYSIHSKGSSRNPAPALVVTPTDRKIDFGSTNLGTTATRSFQLGNTGDLPLAISNVTLPVSTAYSVAPPLTNTVLGAGERKDFTVSFTPTAEVDYIDSISFSTNDSLNPQVTIFLSGSGHVPRPVFSVDPTITALNYGEIEVGYRFGKGYRVTNAGDADLSFDVAVTGDPRFSFSQTPYVPGPGGRGPTTIVVHPGAANEMILRVTFDAAEPVGGSCQGSMSFSNINDANATPFALSLEASVVAGHTLDVALALDRSGSMGESTGYDTKSKAVRRSANLFLNLLRPAVGDRVAVVQFNTAADLLAPLQTITDASRAGLLDIVNDSANLVPNSRTSISAGLLAAFDQLTDTQRDIRAVLIVSDGMENTPVTMPDGSTITLDNIALPEGVAVHSLGLGRSDNMDREKLENVATRSGGSSNITGDVQGLKFFDVEKFFLQIATTILGGTTLLDPVYTIQPNETAISQVELIPADKEATFVVLFKDGVLPWRVVGPGGVVFPAAAPAPEFGQELFEPEDAGILRLKLPRSKPELYVGKWQIQVSHNNVAYRGRGPDRRGTAIKGPVSYGLNVSVLSNLRLLGMLSPQPAHIGDPILVTAFLSEEGIPIVGANVEVAVTHPDGSPSSILLYDDGAHNDGAVNDGEYAAEFRHTYSAGGYSFTYHAVGRTAHGSTFVRETSLGKYVTGKFPGSGEETRPGVIEGECCRIVVRWMKVMALLLLLLVICCWWRRWRVQAVAVRQQN